MNEAVNESLTNIAKARELMAELSLCIDCCEMDQLDCIEGSIKLLDKTLELLSKV